MSIAVRFCDPSIESRESSLANDYEESDIIWRVIDIMITIHDSRDLLILIVVNN